MGVVLQENSRSCLFGRASMGLLGLYLERGLLSSLSPQVMGPPNAFLYRKYPLNPRIEMYALLEGFNGLNALLF